MGETLRHLASKVCCFVVRLVLPDPFLSSGQVVVGIPGGIEANVRLLCTVLFTIGLDSNFFVVAGYLMLFFFSVLL